MELNENAKQFLKMWVECGPYELDKVMVDNRRLGKRIYFVVDNTSVGVYNYAHKDGEAKGFYDLPEGHLIAVKDLL